MERWHEYQYLLVSGSAEDDQARFRALMETERRRIARLHPKGVAP